MGQFGEWSVMVIAGFNVRKRFRQWRAVVAREGRKKGVAGRVALAMTLLGAAFKIGSVGRRQWRDRMRACHRCPVFDASTKACRPFLGSDLGCGCFTPWVALVPAPYSNLQTDRKGCWGFVNLPTDSGIGWSKNPLQKAVLDPQ